MFCASAWCLELVAWTYVVAAVQRKPRLREAVGSDRAGNGGRGVSWTVLDKCSQGGNRDTSVEIWVYSSLIMPGLFYNCDTNSQSR